MTIEKEFNINVPDDIIQKNEITTIKDVVNFINEILFKRYIKMMSEQIAKDICSVQPIPDDTFFELEKLSMPKDELTKAGYEPISQIGFMWIKK